MLILTLCKYAKKSYNIFNVCFDLYITMKTQEKRESWLHNQRLGKQTGKVN